MRIILVGYGVVGKGVTTILAKRTVEKIKDYDGFSIFGGGDIVRGKHRRDVWRIIRSPE